MVYSNEHVNREMEARVVGVRYKRTETTPHTMPAQIAAAGGGPMRPERSTEKSMMKRVVGTRR